jgi:ABC-type branched-subunit amino acid transport system substrate-binding protein
MRSKRVIVKAAVLTAALVATMVATVPAGAQDEKPEAGEIGVTADEIRVAVVADVENPLSPGQFQSQVDAMEAYAKFVNKNGGIAGRDLVIDFVDSRLNPDETRNATITACADDLAMVGTAAVFMNNVDDMVGCVDAEGSATGLPDINTFTQDLVHQCSPVSYSVSPPQLDCTTKDDVEKTYRSSLGQIRYYLSQDKNLHGICVGPGDLKSTEITGRVHCQAVEQLGIELDGEGFYTASARAPQSALAPIVAAAKADESTYLYALSGYQGVVALRKEAKLQGLTSVEVWDCSRSCYSDEFLETGGADVEDQYSFLNTLPLDETKQNKALRDYVKNVGKDNADAFGATGWAAGMLFHQVIDEIVDEHGVNGITRARILDQLAATEDFDAGGLLATTNVGARIPSDCYNLQQVQDGEFVRVHPKKAGTFDCSPKNITIVKLAD